MKQPQRSPHLQTPSVLKRPYKTLYFRSVYDREAHRSSQGCAASDKGAIRAAVVHIFMDEYAKAIVYDRELGVPIYTIKQSATGLQIHYGRALEDHAPAQLRRVK